MKFLTDRVFIISVVLYLFIIAILLFITNNKTHQIIYGLDDAYIHMAIAKNFVQHHVWGITKDGFSSTTSSPLWTLVLSLFYFVFGIHESFPLILNVLFSVATLWIANHFLKKLTNSELIRFISLTLIVLAAPLAALTFVGMEHIMQIFLSTLFLFLSYRSLKEDKQGAFLIIIASLLVFTRYESVAMVLIVCILFLHKKKYLYSQMLGVLSILPIIIYGFISLLQGWHFFPNSILLKAVTSSASQNKILMFLLKNNLVLSAHPYFWPIFLFLCSTIILSIFVFLKFRNLISNDLRNLIFIFIFTAACQIIFGQIGSSFRYEAYLIPLFIFVAVASISFFNKIISRYKSYALILITLFIGLILGFRTEESLRRVPITSNNIYEQQYQMGLFVKQYYNEGTFVVLNDIGAVSFLADIHLIDLFGLGNLEIADLRLEKKFTGRELDKIVTLFKGKIALVYEEWLNNPATGTLIQGWQKIAEWKISNNIACGSDCVSIYAVDPAESLKLYNNLKAFQKKYPHKFEVKYFYNI